jgi:small subunit ribosomal protein S17
MSIKKQIGIVISTKMQKTIVVKVETKLSHPIYSKVIIKTKKYLVHDQLNQCNLGDKILIQETRPLSKRKRWKVNTIISKSILIN